MSGIAFLILLGLQLGAIFALACLLVRTLKGSAQWTLRPVEIEVRSRFHQDIRRPVTSGLGPRFPNRGPPVQPPLYTPDLTRDFS